MASKPKQLNATYCLHCTLPCKQLAGVTVMHCPNRRYVSTRQPDKVYRVKQEGASNE